ncbi:hypothetical protein ES332_D08G275600v1 [Gossypium tomentosum]|uniref:Uncharacterized protein n=1 Tax=Gossypium tomentosum TaxID=34277 RepID=A0A5D2JZB5_GOSTO|nr:hypothetical protein ES332_D08G275600v1 [Gossypium tomentosum]
MTLANGEAHQVTNNGDLSKPFKIFVGYDPREDLAYEVCRHSILKRSSVPVEITPIVQSDLREKGLYWRERNKLESTEFSFSRFLTPYLANYNETTKMDGAVQTLYPRKNWSSMVLYNCGHPKNKGLTPEVVNNQTGAFLHRFQWLEDDEIGSIPSIWNFLEGHNKVVENDSKTFPKAIHYTRGGPWFEAWKNCEFADLWLNEMHDYIEETKLNAS